jgi:predicted ATP-grasp superfamily ATP-dependent carboligase
VLPTVLIAATSGRALAAAARRDGYAPLVADQFGDADTLDLAAAHALVPARRRGGGPQARPLLAALDRLAARSCGEGRAPLGIVCGSGLEGRPALLAALARRRLLGTPPAVMARLKDPFAFAALCRACGVPHPAVARAPEGAGPWLAKRAGAAGGGHVRPWPAGRESRPLRPPLYVQRRVPGRPVAALLLGAGAASGDGRRARVLGFSEQWAAPSPRAPFRYGGAARPAALPPAAEAALAAAAVRVAAAAGVVGLASADFLLHADGFFLIEINPRPGATLDVFAALPLFALHLAACAGGLPEPPPPPATATAAAIVYAPRRLVLPAGFAWPAWAADRQQPGPVGAGAPLATVLAEAGSAAAARDAAHHRAARLLAMIGDAS